MIIINIIIIIYNTTHNKNQYNSSKVDVLVGLGEIAKDRKSWNGREPQVGNFIFGNFQNLIWKKISDRCTIT